LSWVSCNGKAQPIASQDLNPLNITRRIINSDKHPAWSPDGKKIAYSSAHGNLEIYVMNADGDKEINLTNHLSEDYDPTWSPDGKRIAFTSERDGNREIFVMNADGSNPINLTNSSIEEQEPAWSPDGTKIAMIVKMPELRQSRILHVMNADGTNRKQLFEFPDYVNSSESPNKPGTMSIPAWSPDGTQIAFGWKGEIYVVHPDGTEPVQLSDTPTWSFAPSWSPQGTHITFNTENTDRTSVDLMVMEANGNDQRLLLDYVQDTLWPAWSPDGTRIAFSSGSDIYLFQIGESLHPKGN
jgi:Tol biopolymer transport system component